MAGSLTFNVALELYSAKHNLQLQLGPPRPSLEQITRAIEDAFSVEAAALRPPSMPLQKVAVDELELYDEKGRRWIHVDHPMQVHDGCQLYAFQAGSQDDQGRIPPPRPASVRTAAAPQQQPLRSAAAFSPPKRQQIDSGLWQPARHNGDEIVQQLPVPTTPPGALGYDARAAPLSPGRRGFAVEAEPAVASAARTRTLSPTVAQPSSLPGSVRRQKRTMSPVRYHPPDPDEVVADRWPSAPSVSTAARAVLASAQLMHRTSGYEPSGSLPPSLPSRSEPPPQAGTPRRRAPAGSPPLPAAPPLADAGMHMHSRNGPGTPTAGSLLRHDALRPPHRPARVIVVVGCTRGLGEAAVRWLQRSSDEPSQPYRYVVVGCGRSERRLKELKTEMPAVHFYAVDVCDSEGVERFAAKVAAQHGPPSLVIHCAAAASEPVPFLSQPRHSFDSTFDTNLKGAAVVMRSFLALQCSAAARGGGFEGVVVCMSSNWGRTAAEGHAALTASKWALEGLCKSVALELPQSVACVPLNPGVVHTVGLRAAIGDERAKEGLSPSAWADLAMPFLLALSPKDNGRSLTCPGAPPHHYDNALQHSRPMWALGFH
eukprot:TRINITY_DN30829_c0_g1_i1.p1 TRINITY_DN30829_c0_g1~~TRINITY_DN30829_c0_g1_i1.p1  ORF type:complete len:620 (+),score=217.86 TRINITY_DN30829_c0_g1_i1:65-1861(+)